MTSGTLTREAAAKYLNISLPTLDAYLHRAANPIPHIRVGRKYIVPTALLDQWIAAESARQNEGANDRV